MGLIDLQTNLKSLKFGNDQPDGGSSNQPYIQTDIPDNSSPLNGGTNDDFLLRGGINAPLDAAKDVLRLSKFFIDTRSPNGLFFILKQNLLSRTSVRTQASTGPSYGGVEGGVNQGIYTPLNTLAQAGVGFTGTHLNLLGLDPSSPMSGVVNGGLFPNLGLNGYSDVVKFSQNAKNNRLVGLYQVKTLQDPTFIPEGLKGSYAISNDIILSYGGGPNSILGIGKTNIPFADQRTGLSNPNINPPEGTIFTLEKTEDNSAIIRIDYSKPQFTPPEGIKINYNYVLGVSKRYEFATRFHPTTQIRNDIVNNEINPNGDLPLYNSVYYYDTLNPNNYGDSPLFGPKSWTPSFQNPVGPNSTTTYLQDLVGTGSLSATSYNTGITEGGVLPLNSVYADSQDPSSITFLESNNKISENNTNVFNQNQIKVIGDELRSDPKIIDFRRYVDLPRIDYTNKNIERRVNIGGKNNLGPGNSSGKNLNSYTKGSEIGPIDRINAQTLYSSESPNEKDYGDLIKFRIASIDSGGGGSKVYMHFRAFLDSLSDSYNAAWQDHQYLGRGEKFYTYNGFTRAISLSWTVAAQSKEELLPMYEKLSYLASNLLPDYNLNGYMRGPLVTLTVGDYLYEQPGFITALTFDIPQESPWEIAINDSGDPDLNMAQLPHMIKVTGFSFTPIFDLVPRKPDLFPQPDPIPVVPPAPEPKPKPLPQPKPDPSPAPSPFPTPDPTPVPEGLRPRYVAERDKTNVSIKYNRKILEDTLGIGDLVYGGNGGGSMGGGGAGSPFPYPENP